MGRLRLGLRLRPALSWGCVVCIRFRHRLVGVGLVGLHVGMLPFLDGGPVAKEVEVSLRE